MKLFRILAVLLILAAHAHGGDDIQSVAALWSDFVAALRRGDYPSAHAMFSPESREAMPYADFVKEYGPLSAAREMVLAKPETQSTRLDDDWAEISYGGLNPGSGRQFRVGVSLVKNGAFWGLVAARNETRERLEAGARALLRMAATWRGLPDAKRRLAELVALHEGRNPVMKHYRFETDASQFRAVPLSEGLRGFHVDAWGTVAPGLSGDMARPLPPQTPARAMTPQREGPHPSHSLLPAQPIVKLMDGGLPEMSEPPGDAMSAGPPEMAEPPARAQIDAPREMVEPPARRRPSARETDLFTLPDTIQ